MMYCFVCLWDAADPDGIRIAFLRLPMDGMGYFAHVVHQLMQGRNIYIANPNRIDWWRGSVTCMCYNSAGFVAL